LFSVTLAHADTNITDGDFDWDVQCTTSGGERVLAIGVLTITQEVYYP